MNEKKIAINKSSSVLVACSGGRDSMVLAHVLLSAGYTVGLAHVNYKLRDEDSELDQKVVEDFAKKNSLSCHIHAANVDRADNVQLTARKIRYDFFKRLCTENEYDVVATAHHSLDNLETMLLNLFRGTGIYGLKGIPQTNGNIVRPLIHWTRDEINAYCDEHGITYRDDASNSSSRYTRNWIRNELLPLVTAKDSAHLKKLFTSREMLEADGTAMTEMAKNLKKTKGPVTSIDLSPFADVAKPTILYHCIRNEGFNRTQCVDLLSAKEPGKEIFSSTHRACIHSSTVEMTLAQRTSVEHLLLDSSGEWETELGTLTIAKLNSEGAEQADRDKVQFPLSLALAERGNDFTPLGSTYRVNVAKYLKDKKIGRYSREYSLVVKDAQGEVIWICGAQISDKIKVTETTSDILYLSLRPN